MSHLERRRSWKEIAMDIIAETNRQRFRELVQELDQALAARQLNGPLPANRLSQFPANGHQIYENIVDLAVSLMRSDYASMQMLYPERGTGGELRLLAFRGFNPEAAKFWEWVRADSKSTCGIALRDTKRVVASDIVTCSFMHGSEDQEIYLQTGIRSCQTTPLISQRGSVLGMISTHWSSPHQPSEDDLRLFDILAKQATDLLEHGPREQ